MTRERFEVIRDEFEQAIRCQTAFGGVKATLRLWGETIKALEEAWVERDAAIGQRDEAIMENLRLTVEKEGLEEEIAQLKRGEWICSKCGIRNDGEPVVGNETSNGPHTAA